MSHDGKRCLKPLGLMLCATATLMAVSLSTVEGIAVALQTEMESSSTEDPNEGRGVQAHAVDTVRGDARSGMAWLREKLAEVHLTPAKFFLGLGVLGLVMSFNKNKRLVGWAVLSGISWLLLLFGGAALYFQWPYFS